MAFRVADLIVDTLIAHGVDRAFSVPGESFLALLDALYERDEIDLVTCRHEGSASLAAVADAKLTGRAGVMMASRGPGAFNAALGLHVASQEAIPLVLLVGQVDTPNLNRLWFTSTPIRMRSGPTSIRMFRSSRRRIPS
jgi:acetolactate synthase I/II/III large subunit